MSAAIARHVVLAVTMLLCTVGCERATLAPGYRFDASEIRALDSFSVRSDARELHARADGVVLRVLQLTDGATTLKIRISVSSVAIADRTALLEAVSASALSEFSFDTRFQACPSAHFVGVECYAKEEPQNGAVFGELLFAYDNIAVLLQERGSFNATVSPSVDLWPIAVEIDARVKGVKGVTAAQLAALRPIIEELSATDNELAPETSTSLQARARDPAGGALEFEYLTETGEVDESGGAPVYLAYSVLGTDTIELVVVNKQLLFASETLQLSIR